MLAGEGMSQVVRSLQELLARRTYYSGDLLFSVDILRNVTDTFKRATYVPSADDVQVPLCSVKGRGLKVQKPCCEGGRPSPYSRVCRWGGCGGRCGCGGEATVPGVGTSQHPPVSPQRFFQVVSFMVDAENKDKWDDAQQVRRWATRLLPPWLTPPRPLIPFLSPGVSGLCAPAPGCGRLHSPGGRCSQGLPELSDCHR